ncbi:MAG: sulfatase [Halobacteria archaeon]
MNIVFSSVDCARPDAFDQEFYERKKDKGSYFDTCITQAAFTSPSHTSMLSGIYPFNHGVRWLIDYHTDATTLPEVLQEEGYNTAAFVGGYPLPTGNLDKGFDKFEHVTCIDDRKEGRQELGPANILVNRAVNWLDDQEGEDNFVFLHFFDLHFTLRSEFGKRDEPDFDDEHVYENVEQYIGRQKKRYYDEAAFVGRQLGVLDDLIEVDVHVVTADHGSKMPGEHGYPWVYNHEGERVGSQFRAVEVYDNIVRVPLIISGEPFPDIDVHKQVRTIDIAPTLLDGLEIELDEYDEYSDEINGVSLLSNDLPEYAYSETYHGQLTKANKLTHKMNERYSFGWANIDSLVSVRTNEWKLIATANGDLEPVELYHIAQDPSESRNLYGEHPEVEGELENVLDDLIGDDDQRYATADEVDDKTRGHLEDLGYL